MRFLLWHRSIQFGKFGAVLTLETLGQRWNWEKTKVWRFFQKHGDVFDTAPSSRRLWLSHFQ